MKKNVKIIIIAVVIVLAIALVGGYFFINDIMQKGKLVDELSQIEEMTKSGEFDMEKLNEKTSNIVTTGKYAKVEKAAKNYASDVFNKANEIKTVLEDEKMAQLLTASNYKTDGPEFVETKKYLSETKEKLQNFKTEMFGYLEEGKISSYIEAETTDSYSIELYKELLKEDIEMPESERKEMEQAIDKVASMLDIAEEIINFLVENKGQWQVQGEQVVFNSNSLVQKYNGFLTKLRIL